MGRGAFCRILSCARLDAHSDAAQVWFRQHALNVCTELLPILGELCNDLDLKPWERKRLEKAVMCQEVEGLLDALECSHLLKHSEAVASWCHHREIYHIAGIVIVLGELADHLNLKDVQQKRLETALLACSSTAACASPGHASVLHMSA